MHNARGARTTEELAQSVRAIPDWADRLDILSGSPYGFDLALERQGYTPLRLLGAGRDATAFLAWSQKDGHLVAITTPNNPVPNSPEEIRIMRDAEIRLRYPHPNIVAAIDVVVGKQSVYVVSDAIGQVSEVFSDSPKFEKGRDFSQQVAHTRAQSEDEELAVTKNLQALELLAGAVAHLHKNGLVHRDIKPANIVCTPNGVPLLMDFGTVVKPREIRPEMAVEAMGSPGYLAPEALSEECFPHPQQDVYALGCLMYEALCGERPFFEEIELSRGSHMLLMLLPAMGDPTPPSIVSRQVSADLEAVCMKAMSRNTDDRYKDAGEFLLALSNASL